MPFERGVKDTGEPVILFEGTALGRDSTRRLRALILASGRGSREVYLDAADSAIIVPRSRAMEGKQLFDSQSFPHPQSPPNLLLTRLATLLFGRTPSTANMLSLLAAVRASLKLPESTDVLSSLPSAVGDKAAFLTGLLPLLSNEVSVLRDIASVLIAEYADEDTIDDLLATAEAGELPGSTLFSILRGTLLLPVKRFRDTMGLDQHGQAVRMKKLSDCKENEDIVVSSSVVAKNNFFSLSTDTEVFVVPTAGLFRKSGGSKANPNLVQMNVETKPSSFFMRLVAAIQGSSGRPQAARTARNPEDVKVADDEEEL